MGSDSDSSVDARDRLEQESGIISWTELIRHFARGVVIKVRPDIDLIDAAMCLADDDKTTLQAWLDSESVTRASDDDARDWTARDPDFMCVVIAPWVVVQEHPGNPQLH